MKVVIHMSNPITPNSSISHLSGLAMLQVISNHVSPPTVYMESVTDYYTLNLHCLPYCLYRICIHLQHTLTHQKSERNHYHIHLLLIQCTQKSKTEMVLACGKCVSNYLVCSQGRADNACFHC